MNENRLLRKYSKTGSSSIVGRDEKTGRYLIYLFAAPGESLALPLYHQKNYFSPELYLDISILSTQEVAELHENGVAHRDLKPENMNFHMENGKIIGIYLYDFGFATSIKNTIETLTGTCGYVPFHVPSSATYDPARNDIFALGTIILEIFTGLNFLEGCVKKSAKIEKDFFQKEEIYRELILKMEKKQSKATNFRDIFKNLLSHYIFTCYVGKDPVNILSTFHSRDLQKQFFKNFKIKMTSLFLTTLMRYIEQHLQTHMSTLSKGVVQEYQLSPYSLSLLKRLRAQPLTKLGLTDEYQKKKLLNLMIKAQLSGQLGEQAVSSRQLLESLKELRAKNTVQLNRDQPAETIDTVDASVIDTVNAIKVVSPGVLAATLGHFSSNYSAGDDDKKQVMPSEISFCP